MPYDVVQVINSIQFGRHESIWYFIAAFCCLSLLAERRLNELAALYLPLCTVAEQKHRQVRTESDRAGQSRTIQFVDSAFSFQQKSRPKYI